jgi:hypothetical protein
VTTLLVAIITLLGALAGVWLGSHLTRENENRTWRRDRALEAYSDFIRLVDVITAEARWAYLSECGTDEQRRHRDIVVEKLSEMYHVISPVMLLAQAPFSELTSYVEAMGAFASKSIQCPKAPEAEISADREKIFGMGARFLSIARNDLGIVPFGGRKPKRPW